MDETQDQQPARERIGSRAWVRTVGLVGGGLMAGGILAGTMTANADTDDGSTSVPSVTQEQGATTDGSVAPEDCPEGQGPGGSARQAPSDEVVPDSSTSSDADGAA